MKPIAAKRTRRFICNSKGLGAEREVEFQMDKKALALKPQNVSLRANCIERAPPC